MTRKRRFGTNTSTEGEVEQLERDVKKKQLKKQLKELEEQEKKEKQEALFERAKKVEKYFPDENIPEDVKEEQVVKAEQKAKEEKEKAKKEEEEHKKNVEDQGQEAAKKIQKLFRGFEGRKQFQSINILKDLEENFPDSKESSISFPSIDKVNKKLADLFDYVEKNTIEESEETEDLEKQQIEAEIELTKAETKQAIRESERINNFGTESKTGEENPFEEKLKQLEEEKKKFMKSIEQKLKGDEDRGSINVKLKINKSEIEKNINYLKTYQNELTELETKLENNKSNQEELKRKNPQKAPTDYDNLTREIEASEDIVQGENKTYDAMLNNHKKLIIQNLTEIKKTIYEKISESKTNEFGTSITFSNRNLKLKHQLNFDEYNPLTAELLENLFVKNAIKTSELEQQIDIVSNSNDLTDEDKLEKLKEIYDSIKVKPDSSDKSVNEIKEELIKESKQDDERDKNQDTMIENYNKEKIGELKECGYDIEDRNILKDIEDMKDEYIKAISLFNLENYEEKFEGIFRKPLEAYLRFNNEILKLNNLKQYKENFDTTIDTYIEFLNKVDEETSIALEDKEKEQKEKYEEWKENINKLEEEVKRINRDIQTKKGLIESTKTTMSDLIETAMENFENQKKEILAELASKDKIGHYLEFWGFKSEKEFNGEKFSKDYETKFEELKINNNKIKNLIGEAGGLKDLSGENTKKFIRLHEEFLKIKFNAYPVRNIINFSTFIKPPGLNKPVDIFYEEIEGYDKNDSYLLKDSLDEKEGEGEEYKTIQDILGKDIKPIQYRNNNFGPFYRLLHTSNKDEKKKKYDVTVDLDRLFKGELDHITYAGYGFSGSGKTFTLIESPESIVSQVSTYLKNNGKEINLNVHEWYDEAYDSGCMGEITWNDFNKQSIELPHKTPAGYDGKTIVGKIQDINTERKKYKLGPVPEEIYRTSIRRTTFNDQSSRAHMFIDIITKDSDNKSKKITILDMAGAEDADVIQKDYFETVKKIKLENFIEKTFETNFNIIKTNIGGVNYDTWTNRTEGRKIKKAYDNLTTMFNNTKTGTTDESIFIIDPSKWVTLFKDIYGEEGITEGSIYDNFVKYFNRYQYCKQIDFIKTLYDSLKELKETGNTYNQFKKIYGQKLGIINGRYNKRNNMKGLEPKELTKQQFTLIKHASKSGIEKYTKPTYPDLFEDSPVDEFFKYYGMPIENINKIEKNFDPANWVIIKNRREKLDITQMSKEQFRSTKEAMFTNVNSLYNKHKAFLTALEGCINKIEIVIEKIKNEFINKTKAIMKDTTVPQLKKNLKNDINFYKTPSYIGPLFKQQFDLRITEYKNIIKQYHCPLRFQGNAINTSITNFKTNLQTINNNKNKRYQGETFPYNVERWNTVDGVSNPRREFVVFTNIRLDVPNDCTDPNLSKTQKTLCDAFTNSLCFSHELLYEDKPPICLKNKDSYEGKFESKYEESESEGYFGKKRKKKVSKKTSTRSFRRRGRRRGPSGTEIL